MSFCLKKKIYITDQNAVQYFWKYFDPRCSFLWKHMLGVQVVMVHLKVLGNTVSGDLYFYNKQKTASQMQEETKQRRRMESDSTAWWTWLLSYMIICGALIHSSLAVQQVFSVFCCFFDKVWLGVKCKRQLLKRVTRFPDSCREICLSLHFLPRQFSVRPSQRFVFSPEHKTWVLNLKLFGQRTTCLRGN